MIYQRRRSSAPGGYFHIQNTFRRTVQGFGEGDFIRLRDEYGAVWRGSAERLDDHTVRYSFVDSHGRRISGVSDSYGVMLRDEKGNTWRGFVD
jgi:hypothetical protein